VGKLISDKASEMLGRQVSLEGFRVGWFQTVELQRLRVSPIEGEEDFPPLDLAGVSVSLRLIDLLMPPYELKSIVVDKLEVNAVRHQDGVLNFQEIASHFPTSEETEQAEEEPAPSKGPIKMPLGSLSLDVKEINVRWVDFASTETLI